MNIIAKRKIWYIVSGLFMLISFISLVIGGLKLGLDFTGGSFIELRGLESKEKTKDILSQKGFEVISVLEEDGSQKIKTNVLDDEGHKNLIDALGDAKEEDKEIKEIQFSTVGSTVSRDITTKAYLSIALGLLVIILYVAYSFRKSSKYFASWKYGVCAVLAVFHDVIFVIGAFSIMGIIWGVEIDSLFITALLTVISFSVHDTIVIFDRIRENLKKSYEEDFSEVVNQAVIEMFARSLNTSLVILFVILSLLLLGGDSIRLFVLAMFLGLSVGTYSSIFVASPLLVTWKKLEDNRAAKKDNK